MKLNEYLSKPDSLSVAKLAELIGVKSDAQVRQWQHGYSGRQPSPEYALAIERATGGSVKRQDLRPDDYWLIWPDLPEPKRSAKKASA
ncbi:helix-turn-helix domain-containing protein [Hydrogenophaga aromaticivorans]|uniref:transcriptional regulator n=1 Tax=Hydrogenophaga aromaticivorans TaxID=2610898 RepID=UPI001B392788|nr:YdaS family helix-turn-helix protein [Hydrogenophaga aromaticivorans]MBQ0917483.1 helix-turn-helix domain-containing protein [Hydrogenophaga aromaticivorans]